MAYEHYYKSTVPVPRPVDAFHTCPACRSKRVVPLIDDQVYCRDCDWDSVATYAALIDWKTFASEALEDPFFLAEKNSQAILPAESLPNLDLAI